MKKWIIVLAIIVIFAGIGIYVFREQPLMKDGYVIYQIGNFGISDEGDEFNIDLSTGSSIIEYNPSYPDDYSRSFLTIDTDELEAILKTAKCRLSLGSIGPYFSGDVQYQVFVTLIKGERVRHLQLYLGTNNWESGGKFSYTILNADEVISALNLAKSIERVY